MDSKFGNFEGEQLNHVKESVEYVKKSVDAVRGPVTNPQAITPEPVPQQNAQPITPGPVPQSNVQTNAAKPADSMARIRTMPGISGNNNNNKPVETKKPVEQQTFPSGGVSYDTLSNTSVFDSLRDTGNKNGMANASTILIVIASFVIVAMLIIICFTILSTFGKLPY